VFTLFFFFKKKKNQSIKKRISGTSQYHQELQATIDSLAIVYGETPSTSFSLMDSTFFSFLFHYLI